MSLESASAPARQVDTQPQQTLETEQENLIMRMYKDVVGVTIGLILTAAAGWAGDSPKEKKIHGTFAGSFSPSTIDFNNDNSPGAVTVDIGKTNRGPTTSQTVFDLPLTPLPAPVTCPAGTAEFPYLGAVSIDIFDNTLDQLVSTESGGSVCANPDGTSTFDLKQDILYGTGKFAGATGFRECKGSGAIAFCDPKNNCSGSEVGTCDTTVILP
jgi:hypothetical protein